LTLDMVVRDRRGFVLRRSTEPPGTTKENQYEAHSALQM
jgi:hypothetical protein